MKRSIYFIQIRLRINYWDFNYDMTNSSSDEYENILPRVIIIMKLEISFISHCSGLGRNTQIYIMYAFITIYNIDPMANNIWYKQNYNCQANKYSR